jgi:hypothetical protein
MICELGFGVPKVRQAALGSGLRNTIDSVDPLSKFALIHRLEEVMPAILGVQLEDEGAVVVDELRDARLDEADDKRGLARGSEIQLLRRPLRCGWMDALVTEGARDGSHEMQERGHTLLAALVFLLRRRRLLAHSLVKEVFPLLVLRLLDDALLEKARTEHPVPSVLLHLGRDGLLEWADSTTCSGRRAAGSRGSFTLRLLLDPAMVELQKPDGLLNVIEALESPTRRILAIAALPHGGNKIAQLSPLVEVDQAVAVLLDSRLHDVGCSDDFKHALKEPPDVNA